MTGKAKLLLGLALAIGVLSAGFYAGWRVCSHLCNEERLEQSLARERESRELAESELASLRKSMRAMASSRGKTPVQKASWRERKTGQRLKSPPPDCDDCLKKVKREVEIKDKAHGWWVYRDNDVLDEQPGDMRFTPDFYDHVATISKPPEVESRTGEKTGPSITREMEAHKRGFLSPEKSVRAGAGLSSYQLEFEYSPLRFRGSRATVCLGLRSRLALDRVSSGLTGGLSAGIEVRW